MPINYKEYPKDWKQIRLRILERAKNCCEFCGVKNHAIIHRYGKEKHEFSYWPEGMESEAWTLDGLKSTKVILTIAHLDHDKLNHEVKDNRLAALCQKCHLGYDMKNHVSNRLNNKNKKNYKVFNP